MASVKKPKGAAKVLRLSGELTIFRAAELMPVLLASPAPQEIDLSGVTELDTAGLQLLMQAKKKALAAKRELRLVAHSPAVIEVFELLNVAPFFGDQLVMDSRDGAAAQRTASASSAGRGSNGS